MFWMDTPLNKAHDEVMLLIEWALTKKKKKNMVADALSRDPFAKMPWFRKPMGLKGILCRMFSMSVVDLKPAG